MVLAPLDLQLYRGTCQDDGCGEGSLILDANDKSMMRRYRLATDTVERRLVQGYGIELCSLGDRLFRSEAKVQEFYSECRQKIEGSELSFKLSHACHGRIIFDRKLLFNNHANGEQQEIADMLASLDYVKAFHLDKGYFMMIFGRKAWE